MRFLQQFCTGISLGLLAAIVYCPSSRQGPIAAPSSSPQRVVSLVLSADEILLALIPPARISALSSLAEDTRYSNIALEARKVPEKRHFNAAEQVLSTQPDLVILDLHTSATAKDLLKKAGASLLEFPPSISLSSIQDNILALGRTIGESESAHALVAAMEEQLRSITKQVADAPRPKVLYYMGGGLTAGGRTTIDDVILHAAGRNAAAESGIQGYKQLSHESLVTINPEVIVVSGDPNRKGLRELLLTSPALQTVAAIRENRVFTIPPSAFSHSHYIVRGVALMARTLHPGRFTNVQEQS